MKEQDLDQQYWNGTKQREMRILFKSNDDPQGIATEGLKKKMLARLQTWLPN